ncbi:hypothetical protein BH10PSE12_BH10PSE12_01700 [soil metagenome]
MPWPASALADTLYTDESHSLFGTATYQFAHLADALQGLRLNAGYRYTWDKEGVCSNSRAVIALSDSRFLKQPYQSLGECDADPTTFSQTGKFKAGTYTLGLDYTVNNDLFFYATTRTGYRAGGLNTPLMAPIIAPYQG